MTLLKVSGTLFIRSIAGRNGAFSVGRLVTAIGEFAIKDALLDQYDEGRYQGEFGITRIYPSSYVAGNRMVVEVRATLATMALAAIDALPDDHSPPMPEPDPAETEQVGPPAAIPADQPESNQGGMRDASPDDGHGASAIPANEEDERLFGTLWPLGQMVRLDTTVDRTLFRRQKDRLKSLGYRFQPVGQTWLKAA